MQLLGIGLGHLRKLRLVGGRQLRRGGTGAEEEERERFGEHGPSVGVLRRSCSSPQHVGRLLAGLRHIRNDSAAAMRCLARMLIAAIVFVLRTELFARKPKSSTRSGRGCRRSGGPPRAHRDCRREARCPDTGHRTTRCSWPGGRRSRERPGPTTPVPTGRPGRSVCRRRVASSCPRPRRGRRRSRSPRDRVRVVRTPPARARRSRDRPSRT